MFIEQAREVVRIESEALQAVIPQLNETFEQAINMMMSCEGRVVVTGMGKSGLIGKKIAATMASTGTPAFFLHPAEAIHGDLGMVTADDVVFALSNSGETEELLHILPIIRRIGAKIIALTGRKQSTLAQNSDTVLTIKIDQEACPLGLAPTASTTAALAVGDALAVVLLKARHFTSEDFALLHPGGALGRKLLLTVEKLMHKGEEIPIVREMQTMKETLFVMTSKGLGAACVVDDTGRLAGIVTDGDIRRNLDRSIDLLDRPVAQFMNQKPLVLSPHKLAAHALNMMEKHQPRPITVLPVIDGEKRPVGIIHLTDLLRAGVV